MPSKSDSQVRQRTRIAKGIYRDAWGIAATVKAGGLQREKRFLPETSLKTIKAWQGDTRVALRKLAPAGARGTFAADAARYLQGVASMPTYKERAAHVALWIAEFGPRARHTIGTADVDAVLSRWTNAGLSASTVRNRRTVLLHLWNRLDGLDAPNPVRRANKPRMPEPHARALSYAQIAKILAAMPDVGQGVAGKARDDASKTKARLAVIAFTGLPHSLVKQLTPEAVDWRGKRLTVPRRHKGKGVHSRTLRLTDAGLAALRHFADLDCWGGFSNSSMIKSFHRACAAAGVPEARVYDLRHSYATEMYRQTGDPKATAEMLMHAPTSRMMDRYTIAGVEPRLKLAAKAFNATVKAPKWLAVPAGSTKGKSKKTA
jgi:integrase